MASREEKLLAARKKLREFQGKAKEYEYSSKQGSIAGRSTGSTPSPKLKSHVSEITEIPIDAERLIWERRDTIDIKDQNQELWQQPNEAKNNLNVVDREREFQLQLQQMEKKLQMERQAITVLIAERTEAQTTLSHVQSQLQQKSDDLDTLRSKYFEVTRRLQDFESALARQSPWSISNSQLEESLRKAQETANDTITTLQDQLSELRSRLDCKNADCDALVAKVASLENSLSVAEVKIQQLTTEESPPTNSHDTRFEEENLMLRKQVDLLERRLQAAAMEGEQAAHRFKVYAEQCNSQLNSFRSQAKEQGDNINAVREENVQLMRQRDELQLQLNKVRSDEGPMEARINALTIQNELLEKRLQEKEKEIVILQMTEEKLARTKLELETTQESLRRLEAKDFGGRPDPALLAAMESDKVAASRAVAQNQKLKDQLIELQQALVRLSDEKLALTEKLSFLEHQNKELQKEIPQCLTDGHEHDHSLCANDEEASWDEKTLRRVVAMLQRDKAELISRLQQLQTAGNHIHSHHDDDDTQCAGHNHLEAAVPLNSPEEEISELRRAVEQLQVDKSELLKRINEPVEDPEVQGLLQTKLRKTMDEIAALDEEKQRLEHLVLQLQSETETIGEYIALYHKQRLLLKQRSLEKDEQLTQLSKDREDMKEKLASLNDLVSKLVGEVSGVGDKKIEDMTAQKIRALITEIGNNNVFNAHSFAFEQCSCCSGRLITI